jgi:hypothetical protein
LNISDEMLEAAIAAYNKYWNDFSKPIDSANVDLVRKDAMKAALVAAVQKDGRRQQD